MSKESSANTESAKDGCSCGLHSYNNRMPRRLLVGLGLAVVVGVWFFREPLRQQIRESATLANDAPTPEVVSDMIEQATDSRAALLTA